MLSGWHLYAFVAGFDCRKPRLFSVTLASVFFFVARNINKPKQGTIATGHLGQRGGFHFGVAQTISNGELD